MRLSQRDQQESFDDPPFRVTAPLRCLVDGTPVADGERVTCQDCGASIGDGEMVTVWLVRSPVLPEWNIARLTCHDSHSRTEDPFQQGSWQAIANATVGIRTVDSDQQRNAVLVDPTLDQVSPPRGTIGRDPEALMVSPHRWVAAVQNPDRPADDAPVKCPFCGVDSGITQMANPGKVQLDCGHTTVVRTVATEGGR